MLHSIGLEMSPFDEKMLINTLFKVRKEITFQQFLKAFDLDFDKQSTLDISNAFKLLG